MGKRDQGTPGRLVVSRSNPRYFTFGSGDDTGRAVYLAGSHIWNNFHDGMARAQSARASPSGSTSTATSTSCKSEGTTSSGCGGGNTSGRKRREAAITCA